MVCLQNCEFYISGLGLILEFWKQVESSIISWLLLHFSTLSQKRPHSPTCFLSWNQMPAESTTSVSLHLQHTVWLKEAGNPGESRRSCHSPATMFALPHLLGPSHPFRAAFKSHPFQKAPLTGPTHTRFFHSFPVLLFIRLNSQNECREGVIRFYILEI